ncbi:MAG: glutathione peroxidase [Candidatus Methylacidiphilales bacterium]
MKAFLLATVGLSVCSNLTETPLTLLDGSGLDGKTLEGRVVLVVNVASRCGFTKQYAGLQKLHETFGPEGLTVLGFPSNEFGGQEPGSAEEIAAFCSQNYGVTFPLLAKGQTKGEQAHPLFRFLTATQPAPAWNFTKYLVGRDGKVITSFPSRVAPDDPELIAAIRKALAVPDQT